MGDNRIGTIVKHDGLSFCRTLEPAKVRYLKMVVATVANL
jgi:hypothetical protein